MSQETKSITAAKQLLMNTLDWNKSKADNFIRINLRGDIPILRDTNHGAKFILGATRMYINGELNNAQAISQLNTVLKYIASDAHINEYDRNLNGESLETLVNRFAQNVTEDLDKDKEEVSRLKLVENKDYNVVRIDSFEEASKYSQYTSWCITYDEDMFDSYTNNGIAQFYFIVRNGFENEPKGKGENCPLDSYGLSLIAVCVDENGGLKSCTCRWNHDKCGNDKILNTKQISELIGGNFYEVFKPNNKWENALNTALARLKNGENPKEIFDFVGRFYYGFALVELCRKWNLIDVDWKFLSKQWFDYINVDNQNNLIVKSKGKMALIDKKGNIIGEQWFDWICYSNNEYKVVELNGKNNFINTQGNILSNQWFDYATNFHGNFAKVQINKQWNFIDKQGKILSNQWFDQADFFYNGSARVSLNKQELYINEKGEILEVFEEVD